MGEYRTFTQSIQASGNMVGGDRLELQVPTQDDPNPVAHALATLGSAPPLIDAVTAEASLTASGTAEPGLAVPVRVVGNVQTFAAQAGEVLFGRAGATVFSLIVVVAVLGSLAAVVMSAPRVYFAMARDGAFFRAAARVHPRYKTPAASIVAQTLFSILLVLTGSLDAIANYVGFSITLFLGMAVAAVFVLRRRDPDAPRPFRTIGYPVIPAIFVLACFAIVVNSFVTDTRRTLIGAAVIAAGIPLYAFFRRRA